MVEGNMYNKKQNERKELDPIVVKRKELIENVQSILDAIVLLKKSNSEEMNEPDGYVGLLRTLARECALLLLVEGDQGEKEKIQDKGISILDLYKFGLNHVDLPQEDKKEIIERIDSLSEEDIEVPSVVVRKLEIDPLDETNSIEKFYALLFEKLLTHEKPEVREAVGFLSYYR